MNLRQAIAAVMACTVASGFAGGVVGAAVGAFAPGFVLWLEELASANARFDGTEFGLGLGVVSGLFFGAGVGSFLVMGFAWRDAWLARAGLQPPSIKRRTESLAAAGFDEA